MICGNSNPDTRRVNISVPFLIPAFNSQKYLERVHDLLSGRARNARWMGCKLVMILHSQFCWVDTWGPNPASYKCKDGMSA